MKETKTKTIRCYELSKNWIVEIEEEENEISAYLQRKNCGVKMMLFGVEKMPIEEFIEMIETNLLYENYIEDYCQLYFNDLNDMDEDDLKFIEHKEWFV